METNSNRKKVLCPVETEENGVKKTAFWMRMGTAFVNRDGSINLILNALPVNGNKLQIRDFDERDLERANERAADRTNDRQPGFSTSAAPF